MTFMEIWASELVAYLKSGFFIVVLPMILVASVAMGVLWSKGDR